MRPHRVAACHAVFEDPNGVGWNLSVSYNAGLGRYLLCTEHTETHRGKLGVFDAPEPWGPWTTVAYHDNWLDLKGTGVGREMLFVHIVTKWISADGKTLWVVFTGGRDCFNLIRATLTLKQ